MKSAVTNGASVAVNREQSQVPVTSLKSERVRRPSFMIFGVLLVLLAALGGAMLFRASATRSQALVLKNDLAVGEELEASDLVIVDLDVAPNLQWVPAQEQASIVGLSARGPLTRGQLVAASMFAERSSTIGPNNVIVAVAMRAGAMPPTARVGDEVSMQLTKEANEADPSTLSQSTPIGNATIWSISESGSAPGEAIVELTVRVDSEQEVSQAASTGRMKLNLTGDK